MVRVSHDLTWMVRVSSHNLKWMVCISHDLKWMVRVSHHFERLVPVPDSLMWMGSCVLQLGMDSLFNSGYKEIAHKFENFSVGS